MQGAVPGCFKHKGHPKGREGSLGREREREREREGEGEGTGGACQLHRYRHTLCCSNKKPQYRPVQSSPVSIIHLKVLRLEEVEGQHVGLIV